MLEVLVVEDEADIRTGLACELALAGYLVTEAEDGGRALRLLAERTFDVVITDVRLPGVDGLALLERLRRQAPDTVVIIMTAYGRIADATFALKHGAHDYVTKPFDLTEFPGKMMARIAATRRVERSRGDARASLASGGEDDLVGRSPAMLEVRARVELLASSSAPGLITGESGTGKELVARAIHRRSARAPGPFVAVNCAALPEGLIEAELFGHERGAFTGAVQRREGRFRAAHRGTLLLDEIAEISPAVQTKLLRVLEEQRVEPVGSNSAIAVDVRILSATHQDLRARVAAGRFRQDLYYRLNVVDLALPALRERPGDLPLLAEHFLKRFAASNGAPRITAEAWARIMRHPFPGNVRELKHLIERATLLARNGEIGVEHLPLELQQGATPATQALRPLAETMAACERATLIEALRATGGHRARAAQLLEISRKTLWGKMRAHGIGGDEIGAAADLDLPDEETDPGEHN